LAPKPGIPSFSGIYLENAGKLLIVISWYKSLCFQLWHPKTWTI